MVKALRSAHPYEEPAFDLIQLAATPEGVGQGRIGTLAAPADRSAIIDHIKKELGLAQVMVAGPTAGAMTRAAACAGACGDLVNDALAQNAELYLTGELRHHDALRAAQRGMTVVCTLHSNSERAVLRRLKNRIGDQLPGIAIDISQSDCDPFIFR